MATGFFHHIGTFFLLLATVLLIVTCITSPVVHDLGILKVDLVGQQGTNGHGTVSFGTFGYCINGVNGGDSCTPSQVGYHPAQVMNAIENTQFSDYSESTTYGLTKVMVLHPVATALNFIAFILALGAGVFGSLFAALVAVLAFLVTCVVVITDFVLFAIIKSNVNDDNSGSYAYFSVGIWTILVSGLCSLIGAVIVFLTCCSARLHRRRTGTARGDGFAKDGYAPPARRRRWF